MGTRIYEVVVTDFAEEAIFEACQLIAVKSPQNAQLVLDRIFDLIETLNANPSRFSVHAGFYSFPGECRSVVVSNHIIVYTIREESTLVIVHDVYYGGEDR